MSPQTVIDDLGSTWLVTLFVWPAYVWLEWKFPLNLKQGKVPKVGQIIQDIFWDRSEAYLSPLINGSLNYFFYAYAYSQVGVVQALFHRYFPNTHISFSFEPIFFQNIFVQFLIFFLVRDFIKYAIHLLMHRTWLWRFHILHHSSEILNWISMFRNHWTEALLWNWILLLPMLLIKTPPIFIGIFSVIETQLCFVAHANNRFNFGPFKKIINNNVAHHWHHSKENLFSGGQNFGTILLIWDRLFGTFYYPDNNSPPPSYGVAEYNEYPSSILKRFFYPFFKLSKKEPAP